MSSARENRKNTKKTPKLAFNNCVICFKLIAVKSSSRERETARELQHLRMNHTESNIEYRNSAQGQLVEIPEKYNN